MIKFIIYKENLQSYSDLLVQTLNRLLESLISSVQAITLALVGGTILPLLDLMVRKEPRII
jgi:hypothetical protein